MDPTENIIKKYPKSINGNQCIGPCYEAKTLIIHPISLELVTDTNNFCPINSRLEKNHDARLVDRCNNPTENKNIESKELELSMLNPYIDFSSIRFLSVYYNIYTFEDALQWLENNIKSPLETKIRIIRNALFAFGSNIEMVDHRLVDFFIILIKKKYINKIYNNVYEYIGIVKNNIVFINPSENNIDKKENFIERINFIVKIFINSDEIHKFLIRYFKFKKDLLILNYIDDMITEFIQYIISKIKKSI